MRKFSIYLFTFVISTGLALHADEVHEALTGFDDTSAVLGKHNEISEARFHDSNRSEIHRGKVEKQNTYVPPGLSGRIKEQILYTPKADTPHDNISSLQTSLFLDYEHQFENGFKLKVNARAYYDAIYAIRGSDKFSQEELNELRSEVQLFDAYIEGSITKNLDIKVGRQVVVWGRSDTLRVTDVLNPLDNRRPGIQDIEYLRLPVTMAKFDYFIDGWRVTPIAILEQRFSENPPFGSAFYPVPFHVPSDETYSDVTYALSVGSEFRGWDINFYAARIRDDEGYFVLRPKPAKLHEKVNMFGTAVNVLMGDWLLKTEVAYFDGLKYTMTRDKRFTRTDILVGVEYNGIADTFISYDVVSRNIGGYDERLLNEYNPLNKHSYQHAFRIRSDFMNAKLHANYLLTQYGEKLDEGGFQRAWVNYELDDQINTNIGIVDYMGNAPLMQKIKDDDMVFADITYNF